MAKRYEKKSEEKQDIKRYTVGDLIKFDTCLNKYRKDVTLSTGEKINLLDWDTIYFKAGVRNKNGDVLVYHKPNIDNYVPQVEFENKVAQWSDWKAVREWGEKKQLENYSEMVDEVSKQFAMI